MSKIRGRLTPPIAALCVISLATLCAAADDRPQGRIVIDEAAVSGPVKETEVGGKQTWNVHFYCANGADQVNPTISISPSNGTITTKYDPKPVGTEPAITVLTLQTTKDTMPVSGGYTLTIAGSGSKCANYPPVEPKPVLLVRPKIRAADEDQTAVWWFNHEHPEFYGHLTQFALVPYPPPGGKTYKWSITSGKDYAQFHKSEGPTLSSSDKQVEVEASAAPAKKKGTVKATVTVNGVTSKPFTLKVRAPYRLRFIGVQDKWRDPTESSIRYELLDQYDEPLPEIIEWHEKAGKYLNDAPNNNWALIPSRGQTDPELVAKVYLCVQPQPGCTVPKPVKPNHASAKAKIKHWSGEIWVGNQLPDSGAHGVLVARYTGQLHRGYARHCNIKSPPDAKAMTPACPDKK